MTTTRSPLDPPRFSPRWRLALWSAAGTLLLLPLVAMRFTDEVDWSPMDFVVFGAMLATVGIAFEIADTLYRCAAGLALATAFGLVWVTLAVGLIGGDGDPANRLYAIVLAVAIGGALIARLRPRGMALTLLATGVAQAVIGTWAVLARPEVATHATRAGNALFVILFVGPAFLFALAARSSGRPSNRDH